MRYAIIIVASLFVGAPFAAQADFVIKTAPARQASYTSSPPAPRPVYRTPLPPQRPRPPEAQPIQGFGEDVPLRFACRQIVPDRVQVLYGTGVSPKTLVSWKGGSTWGWVLAAAVRPLGLRLIVTPGRVEIIR